MDKWMIKLGTPILALTLLGACNTTNDNNQDVPQDNNAPASEDTNYKNTRYNNEDTDVPDNNVREDNEDTDIPDSNVKENNNREPNLDNTGEEDEPNKIGTHNVKNR